MPTENRSSNTEMVSVQATIEALEEAYAGDGALEFMNDAAQLLRQVQAKPAQHQGEPIMLTAVATLVDDGDGGLEASWLLEGGTAELFAGMTLLVAENAPDLCSEDGSAQVYTHPAPADQQGYPSEDELIANGLGYPISKEDAVKLHYAGYRSEVITILEAWEAIGHDIHINPDKQELMESLRNMAAICAAHGFDMPADPGEVERLRVERDTLIRALETADSEVNTLRAQLAERDALLSCWMNLPRAASSPELNEVRRKTDYLLSASAEPSAPTPVPAYMEAACDKFDWTPDEALRFYAEGKHFDTDNGRTRILCTGAIASHALKGMSKEYADLKGSEQAEPSAPKCETCNGTGMVDDGEITCSEGGIPYENGPVKCMKYCPACKPTAPVECGERAEFAAFMHEVVVVTEHDGQQVKFQRQQLTSRSEEELGWKAWQARAALERKP